jgi:hypothetical protein
VIAESSVKGTFTGTLGGLYFQEMDCKGAVVATETFSTSFTISYTGTTDVGVVFDTGLPAVITKIDMTSVSQPGYTESVTGPTVVHTFSDGRDTWCWDGMGGRRCTSGVSVQPAGPGYSAGLYLSGSTLYVLEPNASGYAASDIYFKK